MKKLMLLALIAGTSSSLFGLGAAAAAASASAAEAKGKAADAAELGHAGDSAEAAARRAAIEAKRTERAARKAANAADSADAAGMFTEPANYGRDAQPVRKQLGRFGTFRRDHSYIFGGLVVTAAVAAAGLVGWIVNKFVVSKKEAQAEVASATQNPALEAQQNVAAQFKPSAKKA